MEATTFDGHGESGKQAETNSVTSVSGLYISFGVLLTLAILGTLLFSKKSDYGGVSVDGEPVYGNLEITTSTTGVSENEKKRAFGNLSWTCGISVAYLPFSEDVSGWSITLDALELFEDVVVYRSGPKELAAYFVLPDGEQTEWQPVFTEWRFREAWTTIHEDRGRVTTYDMGQIFAPPNLIMQFTELAKKSDKVVFKKGEWTFEFDLTGLGEAMEGNPC
jgi:hypothetical protein